MRRFTIVTLGLLFILSAAAAQAPPPNPVPIPFSDVHKGMKGTGYTVMSGHAVTSFTAEVLGTVDQGATQPRMIICRLEGSAVSRTGVLAAMSGSPVYVGNRFLGVVAYSWAYSKEALCGLTPAEDLLAVRSRALGSRGMGPGVRPATLSDFISGLKATCTLSPPLSAAASLPPARPGTETVSRRLADAGFAWAAKRADRNDPPADPSPGKPPGPGGMIGVQLVSGDVQFTAYGTVSWVDGKNFLAFGHPFLNLGSVQMPVVAARVVTPVASFQRGFKLCAPEGPLGMVMEDRSTGVYGRFGERAATLPVSLTFRGPGLADRTYHFSIVRQSQITPFLLNGAMAALWSALEDTVEAKNVLLTDFRLVPESGREIRMQDQAFTGPQALASASDFVSDAVNLLLNNPEQAVNLKRLSLTVDVQPGQNAYSVDTAWLGRPAIAPGQPLFLHVRLKDYQGEARDVSFRVPTAGLQPGRVSLMIGGSFQLLKTLAAANPQRPRTGSDYLEFLESIPSNRSLVVAALDKGQALILKDRRVGGLPPSIGTLLGAQPMGAAAAPGAYSLVWTRVEGQKQLVEGSIELDFEVKETGDEAR